MHLLATIIDLVRVDQAAIEWSWRGRGFSYGLWVDPPGA